MEDTINLLGHALRKAWACWRASRGGGWRKAPGCWPSGRGPAVGGLSLKAALDLDWDDPAALEQALGLVLVAVGRVEGLAAELGGGQRPGVARLAAARQVRDQEPWSAPRHRRMRQGVAKDRRISIEDGQMRHGRKTRSVRIDGYKRHVLCDLDTELVSAVGVTPANVAEAEVATQIHADLDAQGSRLASCTSTGPIWPAAWSATATPTCRSSARPGRSATGPASPRPRSRSTSTRAC